MKAKTKYRIAAVLSAAAVSTMGLGLAGATTAGAASADSTAGGTGNGTAAHVRPAAAMVGTYELFFNSGSGFVDSGQLYLNSDTSWSMQDFTDGGSYWTVGQTLGMSDFNAGYPNGGALGVKVSGSNLGSPAKPGELLAADDGSLLFYATFISPTVPAHVVRSSGPALTAAARAAGGHATFPGTYNTFAPAGEVQTVYNSDNTWSQPGFCNAGTFLSFKVKVGTKITFTDIQADEGCGVDHLWMAKEHGANKLGTASKPGIIAEAPSGKFATWYATLAS